MKLSLIGAGILFIADPLLGLHDYLPDFIGCLLIIMGISDASYLVEKLNAAKRWFSYGAIVSIIRFLISFTNAEAQHTLPLALALAFGVVECIVYIPAFSYLFQGFDYAAMRYGASDVLAIGRHTGFYYDANGIRQYGDVQTDTTGRLARFCQVFIVIRAVASLFPELPALQLSESEGLGTVGGFEFNSIRGLISLATFVVMIVPGIVLAVKFIGFIRKVSKSSEFSDKLRAGVNATFPHLSEMHTVSQMKMMSLAVGAVLLLYMGFYDYQMNVIPRYVTAGGVIAVSVALLLVSKFRKWCLLPVIPAVGTIPLSVKTGILQREKYTYFKEIMHQLMSSDEEYIYDLHINTVDEAYIVMARWETFEAIVCGLSLIAMVVVYGLVCIRHANSFEAIPERDRRDIIKSLWIRFGIMIFGAVLTTAYFTAYRHILPYFDLAYFTGMVVNGLAVVLFYVFSSQANKYVYDNIY